jgi:hypothetical protein
MPNRVGGDDGNRAWAFGLALLVATALLGAELWSIRAGDEVLVGALSVLLAVAVGVVWGTAPRPPRR